MEWIIGLGIVLLFIILGNINKPYVGEQAPTLPDWKFNIMKNIVTGKQIGRASCRERVSSPV